MDRSVAQGRPADPGRPDRPDARRPLAAGWRSPSGSLLAVAALAIYLRRPDVDRYLRPLRLAGGGVPRGPGRHPLPGPGGPAAARQRLLPGRPADRDDRRRGARPPAVPAPAGRAPRCRSSRSGAWPRTTSSSPRSWPRSTSAICWWMLGRLRSASAIRLATTLFFAFGTVFWYAAQLGDDLVPGPRRRGRPDDAGDRAGDRRATRRSAEDDGRRVDDADDGRPAGDAGARRAGRAASRVDPRQLLAGLLFGLACTARLTGRLRRAVPRLRRAGRRAGGAGLVGRARARRSRSGSCWPTTSSPPGQLIHPAYDYLYRLETRGYPPSATTPTGPSRTRATCPRTSGSCCFGTPDILPDRPARRPRLLRRRRSAPTPARRAACSTSACPLAVPRDIGMSVLLTSPAYLLRSPPCRRYGRSRLVTGAALAVVLIALLNLMHFSQGWVQFGYRFSNDFAPFALLLVALGFERLAGPPPLGHAAGHGPRRRLDRGQRLGRGLGDGCSDGERGPRPCRRSLGRRRARRVRGRARWRCCPASPSGTPASSRRSAPLHGHGPPDRLPDLRAPRLARVDRPPAVRRAGLPDEPAGGALRGGRRRRHGRSRPALTRSTALGHPGRPRAGADADRLGHRRRTPRRTRSTSPSSRPALPAGRLGDRVGGGSRRGDRARGPGRPLARRGGLRLRAGRRQPLADPAARPPDRPVRVRRRPADLAARPARRCAASAVLRADRRARLPRAAAPGRAVPRPARLRPPETWDGFWYIVLAEQFRGSVIDPFGDLPRKFGELLTRTAGQFGPLAPLIPLGFLATALRRPRYALLTGTAAGSPASSPPRTSTPTSAATTSGRGSSPGPGWRSSARAVVELLAAGSRRPGAEEPRRRPETPPTRRLPAGVRLVRRRADRRSSSRSSCSCRRSWTGPQRTRRSTQRDRPRR